jgi:hypothetical protein
MQNNVGIYASQISGHLWAPNGAYDALATVTVGSTSVATISFAGIPQGYKHLQIRAIATTASSAGSISFRFNGDSSANYTYHRVIGGGAGSASASSATNSGRTLATIIATGTTAPSAAVVDILDYTSTFKLKTLRSLCGYDYNGSGEVALYSCLYTATPAAITSIDIIVEGGASYATNTQFALYGVK